MTELALYDVLSDVIIKGDLGKLSPQQRVSYYLEVCKATGLNPATRPFDYIRLNNKLVLYCRKEGTDQLRRIHNVNIEITDRSRFDAEIYVVTARASLGERSDESTGAVNLANLKGDQLANTYMKAETKAKRRVTLSIVGLGFLDETEVVSIPDAEAVVVDAETGEIETAHWFGREGVEERFHAWLDEIGISFAEACAALNVESPLDYTGNMRQAKETIEQFALEHLEPDEDLPF